MYRRVPAPERFADAFAGCFLMPAAGLRRRFNEMYRAAAGEVTMADVVRIADYYFVSIEAVTLRLEELRLLYATGCLREIAAAIDIRFQVAQYVLEHEAIYTWVPNAESGRD